MPTRTQTANMVSTEEEDQAMDDQTIIKVMDL